MQSRIDYGTVAPAARDAVMAIEKYVRSCGLEQSLLELVRLLIYGSHDTEHIAAVALKDYLEGARAEDRSERHRSAAA